jgi:hypothetical protein
VASFLYLPQGLYGAVVQLAIRLVRSRGTKESTSETSARAL